ncbi:hypothetical protein PF006_g29467 [Phytophthora fragariae]|uniref:WLGC domain-containing protein n=1 Tax=Phytophthora fragariae TaxID=53985 RepID=A0A6A3Q6L4_9STRA|nr:hypothetical protein PF006_g29467 [Phytophthora fragariae]
MWGTPAATCLGSDQTIATAVKRFSVTTCGPVLQPGVLVGPPTPEIMAPCNGTMWKRCEWPGGVEAMCYNARFMVIACTTSAYPIKMRRRQIERSVGDRYNLAIEAWLGYKAS